MKREFGRNIFDILRLYAVFQVVIGHASEHLNIVLSTKVKNFFSIPGVVILFAMSGFLVTASYDRSLERKNSNFEYLKKRFFRIFPGLWCCIIISTVVIGVLYNVKPNVYEAIVYFVTQMFAMNFYTGNWLREYGVGAPNGSLWTIITELQFYVVLIFVWNRLKKQGIFTWLFILGISMGCNFLVGKISIFYGEEIWFKLIANSIIPFAYIFLIGMFCYRYREKMFRISTVGYVGIFLVLVFLHLGVGQGLGGFYVGLLSGICIAFMVIVLAYLFNVSTPLPFDITYGAYLYHMVIINAFVHLGYCGNRNAFYISLLGSIVMGGLSWYCLEKRFVTRVKYVSCN